MAPDLLGTLVVYLQVLRPAFTEPGYRKMLVLFAGWVLTRGRHAVTQALVETKVSGQIHHEGFHRFFSRGTWSPDEVARLLFERLRLIMPEHWVVWGVIDDTLAPKRGPHVFGIGSHVDPVRSSRLRRVMSFGHCWVVLAILVPLPFSRRQWALPLLFRLYRNKKECVAKGARYRKKTELAREMLDVLCGWVKRGPVRISADSAYCNSTITRGLPERVVLFGSMRPDAVLTRAPLPWRRGTRGRPRLRGAPVPKPHDILKDKSFPWQTGRAMLYGTYREIRYKTVFAQWYRACGPQLLRIVIVPEVQGRLELRVFFATDDSLSPAEVLEGYSRRWNIEVTFRELKQDLGFAHSSARKPAAVKRTAPFVGLIYTALVLWFAEFASQHPSAAPPVRPWYRRKRSRTFADVLRTAQRALATADIYDPASAGGNLQKFTHAQAPPPVKPFRSYG